MKPRLLTILSFATGLLLSTLGCSKKDDPQSIANTGSYVSDGRKVSCTATGGFYSSLGNDNLTFDLATTPQPPAGKEVLRLIYTKSVAQPTSDYALSQLQLLNNGAISTLYNADAYTLTSHSDGTFSGTFSSGTKYPNPGTAAPILTGGVFSRVHP
ncbi:hypothetical protein [Hymenobacter convexus]|uniref:hypothetical protein n=1 Tax=Hymenobacter sp. CA1UV-4 TaxID=3063782 RepID=UPI0027139DBB|nr:hypothetical protein [Hymenobacter sp. CA1UV-4]MDO7852299.1 hypothetical protein [Hymenobacter sp. CA1UV-4]